MPDDGTVVAYVDMHIYHLGSCEMDPGSVHAGGVHGPEINCMTPTARAVHIVNGGGVYA